MRHPILLALAAGALVLLAALALPLWYLARGPAAVPIAETALPWQARAEPDGTLRVMGLHLGRDTLADASTRIGDALQVALVARLGEVGALEALADPFSAGYVTGRLVLGFDVPVATLQRWRAGSPRSEAMDGGVRRFVLSRADRDEADSARVASLAFLPTLRLSADDLRQRFGAPAQLVTLADDASLLLYPPLGLAASAGTGGRAVLQFVAPRDFGARLPPPSPASAATR